MLHRQAAVQQQQKEKKLETLEGIRALVYLIGIIYTIVILPTTAEKVIIAICVSVVFIYAILEGVICVAELFVRLCLWLSRLIAP